MIPADKIGLFIQGYDRPDRLGYSLAWREQSAHGVSFRFPRYGDIAVPAGNKTEAAEADRVTLSTAENSATPAFVAFEMAITDEAKDATVAGLPAGLIAEAVDALEDRRDSDILAASTSATSIAGADTDTLSEEKVFAAVAVWKLLENKPGPQGTALVLSHSAASHIRKDVQLTTASSKMGTDFGSNVHGSYMGVVAGLPTYETGNVSTTGAGQSNFITKIGDRHSGLGLVEAEGVTIESNRGAEGARQKESYYVFSAAYGTGLTHANKITEVLSA